jgi:N-methylhydantoinase A
MAQAVKMVLTSRGRDPRDYSYVSFGGAGALHASFVAKSLSVPKVIVPAHAGVASALGAVTVDLRHDLEAFFFATVDQSEPVALSKAYEDLEEQGRTLLRNDGVGDDKIELKRTAQMRYVGQTYEVEADVPSGRLTSDSLQAIASEFHVLHKREYGVSSADFAPAFVSIGVTAIGKFDTEIDLRTSRSASLSSCLKSNRDVYLDGKWASCPVNDGESLPVGEALHGPAIVEFSHACAVIPVSTSAVTNSSGHLVITLHN